MACHRQRLGCLEDKDPGLAKAANATIVDRTAGVMDRYSPERGNLAVVMRSRRDCKARIHCSVAEGLMSSY